jgi:hypothetical protein
VPVERHGACRLAHRVAYLARAEEDVVGDVDVGDAGIRPGASQIPLGAHGDGLTREQRVPVVDPLAEALPAVDPALVAAADLVEAPLDAAVALDLAPHETPALAAA